LTKWILVALLASSLASADTTAWHTGTTTSDPSGNFTQDTGHEFDDVNDTTASPLGCDGGGDLCRVWENVQNTDTFFVGGFGFTTADVPADSTVTNIRMNLKIHGGGASQTSRRKADFHIVDASGTVCAGFKNNIQIARGAEQEFTYDGDDLADGTWGCTGDLEDMVVDVDFGFAYAHTSVALHGVASSMRTIIAIFLLSVALAAEALAGSATGATFTGASMDVVEAGGTPFCQVSGPTGGADSDYCEDFEEAANCDALADCGTGSSGTCAWDSDPATFDCQSATTPIDGTYSLELTTSFTNLETYCNGGTTSCTGVANITGVACYKFTLKVINEGSSTASLAVFVPRNEADGESNSFTLDPSEGVDFQVVWGDSTPDAITEGTTKTYCLEEDVLGFTAAFYSGADCSTAIDATVGSSFTTPAGLRVRGHLDEANYFIDNITLDDEACQTRW